MKTLAFGTSLLVCTSVASADIYQWFDGDNDGSLWLSDSDVGPYADLQTQVLWWAELPSANLHHANLVFSNLSYANLAGATLNSADLSYTSLYEANLEESVLAYATLYGADLRFSNINNANMFYADFSDADLSYTENWETAFWLAARYNSNTIFPEGMNPDDYAMIYVEVPAPASMLLVCLCCIKTRRRRM